MSGSDPVPRLDLYRHCPRCGAAAIAQHPPHLVICHACDLHLYQNASAAAAAIVVDPGGQVLLIRRAHEPAQGKLAFPGGFVDNDESAEDALRREVREEIGLELDALQFLLSHPNRYPFRGVIYPTIDLMFVARVRDLAAARPLDAVSELIVLPLAEVQPAELAFRSMQAAWHAFIALPR